MNRELPPKTYPLVPLLAPPPVHHPAPSYTLSHLSTSFLLSTPPPLLEEGVVPNGVYSPFCHRGHGRCPLRQLGQCLDTREVSTKVLFLLSIPGCGFFPQCRSTAVVLFVPGSCLVVYLFFLSPNRLDRFNFSMPAQHLPLDSLPLMMANKPPCVP